MLIISLIQKQIKHILVKFDIMVLWPGIKCEINDICVKFLLELPTFGLQMLRFRKRYIPSSIFFFHLGPCNSTIIIPFPSCHWIRGLNSPMIRWHQDMGLIPDTSICGLRMLCSYRIRYQPWFNNWPHYRGLAIPTCITCRDAFRDR